MAFQLKSQTPIKQTYKEDTSRFENFDIKNDTLIKGNSMDLSASRKIAAFNARSMPHAYKDEKTFKEKDGSYSTMRTYKKDAPGKQLKSPLQKQKLSPKAAKAKADRDLAYAKSDDRTAKKAHSQRMHRKNPGKKGMDYDHEDGRFESVKQNRGNEGEGTKKESGKKYKTK